MFKDLNKFLLFSLICVSFLGRVDAQDDMRVVRCKSVDRSTPIQAIYVDEKNQKWVGNSKGLYRVHSANSGEEIELSNDMMALLRYPGGNQHLIWSKQEMITQMKSNGQKLASGQIQITTASFDRKRNILWVGTDSEGIFKFKVEPQLQLLEHQHSGNSKLKSNTINIIHIDEAGKKWIGTAEGLLRGDGKSWQLDESDFNIQAVTVSGRDVWMLGDGWLWQMDSKKRWQPVELKERLTEGNIIDLQFDSQGRIWIASEILVRYNPETDEHELFGGPENFTSEFINIIAIDQDDALWVGTDDKGLYLLEKESNITVSIIVDKHLSCEGETNDAALMVEVVGGESPYTFDWNAGLSGKNPTGVGPGEYLVTVTDAGGRSKAAEVTLSNPRIKANVQQVQAASAPDAADAQAEVSAQGGTGKYTYRWDNQESVDKATQLNEGAHNVTVTDEAGCSTVATVNIGADALPLQLALEQSNAIPCNGANDGAISASVSGGTAPFTYQWNQDGLQGEKVNGLAAGNYQLTVTDAAGVSQTQEIAIQQPDALTADITIDSPASTGNADGQATVKATGGDGNYKFSWDTNESGATASKLGPGTHSVTITDGAGCSTIAEVEISENILPLQLALEQTEEINCNSAATAAITASVKGGKGPFTYQWSDAQLQGESAQQLAAGNYGLTITDAEGATKTAELEIKQPDALTATASVDSPASTGNADGKATAKATGGDGNYKFSWDTNESGTTASKLGPGTHTVTITDGAGCSTTAEVEISENILPLQLALEQSAAINCNGAATAAITASVKGGKGPFTYQWSDAQLQGETAQQLAAGNYGLTITDAEGATKTAELEVKQPDALTATASVDSPASTGNADGKATVKATGGDGNYKFSWDTNESGATASKLGPGTHTVTITDGAGCSTTTDVEISENILPLQLALEQSAAINCNGAATAAITASVKGGKGPFTYQWSDPQLKGETAQQLAAGNYGLTITDAEGTTKTAELEVEQPDALTATASVDSPASTGNADGKATVKVKGGDGNYKFSWDTNESSATAGKLGPGSHTVTITDGAGCSTTAEIEITENILPLQVSVEVSQAIKCQGAAEAALAITIQGGKGPFNYQWSDAAMSGEQPQGLKAGTYALTVTDGVGTTSETNITIEEPTALQASVAKVRSASYEGTDDGKAFLDISGGTPPYQVNWDNGTKGEENTTLAIGDHQVSVSDANGCSEVLSFSVKQKIMPQLTASRLRQGETLRLEQLYFEADSSGITNESRPVLDEVYEFLDENPSVVIEVRGHTNGIPEHAFCDRLSTARAKSVAGYIISKGIDPKRIAHKGYGKRKPIATNKTPDGRQKNQRVEIKILSFQTG